MILWLYIKFYMLIIEITHSSQVPITHSKIDYILGNK